MNPIIPAHSHLVEYLCPICVAIAKREMAQELKNAIVRFRLARKHRDEFIFSRESAELWDRSDLMPQWMDIVLYTKYGTTFEDVG